MTFVARTRNWARRQTLTGTSAIGYAANVYAMSSYIWRTKRRDEHADVL